MATQCPVLVQSVGFFVSYDQLMGDKTDRSVGAIVKLHCVNGYVLTGPSEVTCTAAGTWNPSETPKCVEPGSIQEEEKDYSGFDGFTQRLKDELGDTGYILMVVGVVLAALAILAMLIMLILYFCKDKKVDDDTLLIKKRRVRNFVRHPRTYTRDYRKPPLPRHDHVVSHTHPPLPPPAPYPPSGYSSSTSDTDSDKDFYAPVARSVPNMAGTNLNDFDYVWAFMPTNYLSQNANGTVDLKTAPVHTPRNNRRARSAIEGKYPGIWHSDGSLPNRMRLNPRASYGDYTWR